MQSNSSYTLTAAWKRNSPPERVHFKTEKQQEQRIFIQKSIHSKPNVYLEANSFAGLLLVYNQSGTPSDSKILDH